ncbi:hypothetical protein BT69DRAFT_1280631 [Atractiella rhizophila]|nr:hypothetical protein BT69DRAFT_1280631 [Atractiella rhizophila]
MSAMKDIHPSQTTIHPDVVKLSPSITSILKAYEKDGNGDIELLKSILEAKRKEDERLTALTNLHLETLRTENIRSTSIMLQMSLHTAHAHAHFPSPQSPPPASSPPPLAGAKRKLSPSTDGTEHGKKRRKSSSSHGEVLANLRKKLITRLT